MGTGLITLLMFGTILLLLVTGLPIAFCLGFTGLAFTYFLWGAPGILQVASTAFAPTLNTILIAIPLFIFMAKVLESSGIAEKLYDTFYKWSGGLRGGLAVGTVIISAIFAAMSGITGPAVVSMGLIAIPSMIKKGYNPQLAVGSVAAAGALGILIPPSVLMVIYSSCSDVSVGKLFAAGILPGLLLAGLYGAYITIRCYLQPNLGPGLAPNERATWKEKFRALKDLSLPLMLVIFVLGSIFGGFATPTEASAVGAIGSLICSWFLKKLSWASFKNSSYEALKLSTMVMWMIIGATCFANVYASIGAPALLSDILNQSGLGRWEILFLMQLSFFILGMIMDPTGIILITTPVYLPIIIALNFDPIWFGILFIINMEMAYITPPFGYNLFYMKSIVPSDVLSMGGIYMSVIPFILIQGICLILIVIFPQITLWLPSIMAFK